MPEGHTGSADPSSERSGGGGDIAVVIAHHPARTAARARRFDLAAILVTGGADRGGKDAERDALVARVDIAVGVAANAFVGGLAARALDSLRTLGALGPIAARTLLLLLARLLLTILTLRLLALRTIVAIVVTIVTVVAVIGAVRVHALFVVAVKIIVALLAATALLLMLVFEPRAAVLEDAEIMVGELEVIFGLDAVPGKLRVARHALVFLEELGGVAALTIVARVATAAIALHPLRALSTAATTAAALLTIVDQVLIPCRTGIALTTPKTHSFAKEYWNPGEQVGRAVKPAAATPPLPPSAHRALGTAIFAGVGYAALLQIRRAAVSLPSDVMAEQQYSKRFRVSRE